ncbi:MAG: acyltransferase family protein [Pirellulales bacterium]
MEIEPRTPTPSIQTSSTSASGDPNPNARAQRIHYLDNLRAAAMFLGVVLHAGLAYANPAQSVWLATDTRSSIAVDMSLWFIHLFRMSLFFLLSGYFAKLVVTKKGWAKFLRQRGVRIFLPFMLFYVPLLVATVSIIVFALKYLDEPRGIIGLIASADQAADNQPSSNAPTTMHLWFLYYLGFFTLLTPLCARFRFVKLDFLITGSRCLIVLPMVIFPAVVFSGVPLPAPESFIPTWWPFLFYGSFYWLGWQIYDREGLLDQLQPKLRVLLSMSVLLYIVYYITMPVLQIDELMHLLKPAFTFQHAVSSLLTAYLSVWLTICAILLGRRFLESEVRWVRWLSDASYWVYLVHLPIVLGLQTLMIPLPWPVVVKLPLCIAGTLIPCLVSYVLFVRFTPIGWMLHGKRPWPRFSRSTIEPA